MAGGRRQGCGSRRLTQLRGRPEREFRVSVG
jgi:hypothetical protein